MSASDPKKQLDYFKEKHTQIVENMSLLREKIRSLAEAFELAESIEQEIWDSIKLLEKEIKEDEQYMKQNGIIAGMERTKKETN